MARRFGGRYSPDNERGDTNGPVPPRPAYHGKRRARGAGRANFLFLAALPFLVSAFFRDTQGLLINLGAGGLLVMAAWLTRDGIRAQDAYEARRVARRPAIPRKLFGAALTGGALALVGATGESAVNGVIFGVLGAALHLGSFGLDPFRDKTAEGADSFQSRRVARAVDEAESHLAAMRDAVRNAGDRAVEARVDRFMDTARDMFRAVENDPRDLSAARRWLGVYLLGARDATIKFADLYGRTRDARARADYLALLDDLEQGFAERTRRILLDDRSNLDIEIEVLRDRLEREGLPRDD